MMNQDVDLRQYWSQTTEQKDALLGQMRGQVPARLQTLLAASKTARWQQEQQSQLAQEEGADHGNHGQG